MTESHLIKDDDVGYILAIHVPPSLDTYGQVVARVVLSVLRDIRFTGRCEYYARDGDTHPYYDGLYRIGLALRSRKLSECGEMEKILTTLPGHLADGHPKLQLHEPYCELADIGSIRECFLFRSAAAFADGKCELVFERPVAGGDCSWFELEAAERR